jgi:hypothetical protein
MYWSALIAMEHLHAWQCDLYEVRQCVFELEQEKAVWPGYPG